MKKIFLQILAVLFLAGSIAAQSETQKAFDEWGEKTNSEDMSVRLSNLTLELGNRPGSKIAIKVYGGTDKYFTSPYWRGAAIISYFKGGRFSPESYSIEYCNVNREALRTEFFILPQSERLPKCAENLETPAKTVLFENIYFTYSKFKFMPLEDTLFNPVGAANGEYSEAALGALKRLLKKSPESKIYIISYLKTNFSWNGKRQIYVENPPVIDKKSLGHRMRRAAQTEFIKKGVAASQIITVDGGYVNDFRTLELWFVPKGGEIPKPKPDYFPKKAK
ncbi:MAG TPA: hypothetical protein VNB22_08080 [Pyrinomonadaceae bacterium]|nr:hypothetical protein [Pyrinomonadaceae bacterium]